MEIQNFDCGCKEVHIGEKRTWTFCILHRLDNLPDGADPLYKNK